MFRKLIDYFFFLLPVIKFQVKEKSMEPTIKEGSMVLVGRYYFIRKPKVGEIVIVKINGKYIIKRIDKIGRNKIFIIGDNKKESIDSRNFGWVEVNNVIGKVLSFEL